MQASKYYGLDRAGSGTCPQCGMTIDLPTWAYGHACKPIIKKEFQKEQKRLKKLLEKGGD